MRPVRTLLARQELWPLAPIALAAVLLFVRLGSYGFLEPHEIQIAERARATIEERTAAAPAAAADPDDEEAEPEPPRAPSAQAGAGVSKEPGMEPEPGDKAARKSARPSTTARAKDGPQLTNELVTTGIDRFGQTELGARFFVALAGLVAVVAVALLGLRLGGGRAGMLSGLVFLSFPIVLLESRHLTSDIGAVAGASVMALGLVGLVRPSPLGWLRPPWTVLADLALVLAGGLLAHRGAASWNGLVPPLAGVGLGALIVGVVDSHGGLRKNLRPLAVASLLVAAAAVVLAGVLSQVYDLVEVADGERGLFDRTLRPVGGHIASLGGAWRKEGDPSSTTTSLFEQLAFGTFPWVALAPLALAGLALGRDPARRFGAAVLTAWALVAWALATVFEHFVAGTTYPAYAAVAVAIGLWLDGLWQARSGRAISAPSSTAGGLERALPIAAVFVFSCALVVGRDLYNFPDRLLSLNLDGQTLKWPAGVSLHKIMPVLGVAFGGAMAAALLLVGPRARLGRRFIVVGVAVAVLGAIFFSQVFSPALADRMSSRGVFAAYQARRQPGDELGIVGNPGAGPRFYAGPDVVALRGRTELLDFLRRPTRVFALARASELCPLHKAAGAASLPYVVIDDSNEQFLLLSNRLGPGEEDHNPLSDAIVRTRPTDLGTPLDVEFEGTIRLIGLRLPEAVDRGDTLEGTLIFEVLKPITRNWKVFMHFDAGTSRFIGDHDPIRGRCGTSFFQAGDIVLDHFSVKAGSMVDGTPRSTFKLFAGFFYGTNPNYTNMKVSKGNADDNNRVHIGSVRLR